MGKKISVDSATMVNKILEIIEAHVLFGIPIDKIKIKIHKESLVHAAIVLNNGLVKFAMHDTSMSIPIRNCLLNNKLFNQKKIFFSDTSNFNLSFNHVQLKQYDVLNTGFKILKLGQRAWILFNVINDKLVDKFLKGEIFFYQITQNLIKIFNKKSTIHYCKKKIIKFSDIMETINFGISLVK